MNNHTKQTAWYWDSKDGPVQGELTVNHRTGRTWFSNRKLGYSFEVTTDSGVFSSREAAKHYRGKLLIEDLNRAVKSYETHFGTKLEISSAAS